MLLLLLPSLGQAALEDWHPTNQKLFKSYIVLNAVDVLQTFDLIDCQDNLAEQCPYAEGNRFVGTHPNIGSKEQILNNAIVSLGGRVAEEEVFGKEVISNGASSDLAHVTSSISKYVRTWALDMHDGSTMGYYQAPYVNKGGYLFNIQETDARIEKILRDKYSDAVKLIKDNMDYLLEVTSELMEKSTLTQQEFQTIAEKYMG